MISLSKPAPDSGFTLMEMMVVIAIMGLILVMVTSFGPPRSHRLEARAAAEQVAQAMRAARGQAVAQGEDVTLVVPSLPKFLTVTVQPPGGIVFAPDGSASGGRVLLDGDGRETVISADWLTGGVKIDAQ